MVDYDDPSYNDYSEVDTVFDDWNDAHGYRHITCPHCGWSGMTDGDVPECGCVPDDNEDDENEEDEEYCCPNCGELEDHCRCDLADED
jgi:hypothetical protein